MKWNQQLVKVNNKQLILETIKECAPISRADISQQLGLTKGTVSSLVNELLEAKICYEVGPGESSGGRRPVMLLFNERAGYSIGIDLGVNYILAVLTDLNGVIVQEMIKAIRKTNFAEIMIILKEMIHNLIHSSPKSHYGVIGIGIGVPGIVNNNGEILLAPNLGWKNIKLKQEIENEFNLPVIIENEANAGAFGEKNLGAGKNYENLIYISAGIGIGVGLILNSELYRGSEGFSGEMGHMIIKVDGHKCRCGSIGCWELYASENALINQAAAYLTNTEETTLEQLIDIAREKEDINNLFIEIGKYLGIGINNIANTFNPQQIIIGNRLAMAKDLLIDPIIETVNNFTLKHNQKNLKISFSDLSIYSSALGVSVYSIENFLKADLHDTNTSV
jgi:glucokinase-like ROK family protein